MQTEFIWPLIRLISVCNVRVQRGRRAGALGFSQAREHRASKNWGKCREKLWKKAKNDGKIEKNSLKWKGELS